MRETVGVIVFVVGVLGCVVSLVYSNPDLFVASLLVMFGGGLAALA